MSRYVVGIDLGTTHSALAYAPIVDGPEPAELGVLGITQLVAKGTLGEKPLLPSFHYAPHASDGTMPLPWDDARAHVVGELARTRGVEAPNRVISSAKSWLSHSGVDRRAAILPHGAPEDVEKVSPVEASFRYLEHIAEAWEHAVAGGDPELALGKQEIVLTVPASFDEGARALTVQAARQAGLPKLRLLEEPQAACYDWLFRHQATLNEELAESKLLLVCDVGGGTTDLSLIQIELKDGQPQLKRIGVGNHIRHIVPRLIT